MPLVVQTGSRAIVLLTFNFGAMWAWVVNATPWTLYSRETGRVPTVQEAGWPPGPIWTGVRKRKCLANACVRTPNRPARSESLYRLSCPGSRMRLVGSTNIEYDVHGETDRSLAISVYPSFENRIYVRSVIGQVGSSV